MKLIDRYLVWHFLIPFAYCLFAFVILYITYDLSINMDDFFRYKISFSALSQYYLYNLPLIFVNSAPIAILLSLLYSLGLMNRHHEIVALRASGVHIGRILLPFLIVGTILAVFIFYINDSMVCTSFFEKTALREQIFEGEESKITTIWKNIPFRNPASNRDWFIEQ
ncbi:LptF/LptG family permease, partial [bacterium]|nr:LptF/LptG family permease [bacterium]